MNIESLLLGFLAGLVIYVLSALIIGKKSPAFHWTLISAVAIALCWISISDTLNPKGLPQFRSEFMGAAIAFMFVILVKIWPKLKIGS